MMNLFMLVLFFFFFYHDEANDDDNEFSYQRFVFYISYFIRVTISQYRLYRYTYEARHIKSSRSKQIIACHLMWGYVSTRSPAQESESLSQFAAQISKSIWSLQIHTVPHLSYLTPLICMHVRTYIVGLERSQRPVCTYICSRQDRQQRKKGSWDTHPQTHLS